MRDLAIHEYGCSEFVACMEGDEEIAISYWQHIEQIHRWRANAEHRLAQEKGRLHGYQAHKVQVVEIQREYSFSQSSA